MERKNQFPLPERGYRQKIAAIVGCDVKTVTNALRTNIRGLKSNEVRDIYHKLYVKPYLKKQQNKVI